MNEKLTINNYYKELKNLGFHEIIFSEIHSNKSIFVDEEIAESIQLHIFNSTKNLKDNEIKKFYVNNDPHNTLFFVSDKNIFTLSEGSIFIYNKYFEILFTFDHNVIMDRYALSSNNFDYLSFINNKEKNSKFLLKQKVNSTTLELEINDNKISIHNAPINLTSLSFSENEIIATFKGTSYSKIIFDYNCNIKTVEIAKSLIQKFKLDSSIQYNNVNGYSDLMLKIENSLKDTLDFHALISDKKHSFKGSEERFERDLQYIKKLLIQKNSIFELYNQEKKNLQSFSTYYKEYLSSWVLTLPNEYDLARYYSSIKNNVYVFSLENSLLKKYPKIQENDIFELGKLYYSYDLGYQEKKAIDFYKNISFIDYMKTNNLTLINHEIIDSFMKTSNNAKKIMEFNNQYVKFQKQKLK